MNEDKDRVWIISANDIVNINKKVESFLKKGYRLVGDVKPYIGVGGTCFLATLVLQEPSKYEDMLAFKKIPITFEEQQVPQGWKGIHHTSKEMILKKVGEDPFYTAMRERIASDGELDSAISIVEDYC